MPGAAFEQSHRSVCRRRVAHEQHHHRIGRKDFVHRLAVPVPFLRVLVGLQPFQSAAQARIPGGNPRLLQHNRREAGGITAVSHRVRRLSLFFPRPQRFHAPTAVRLLFAPDLLEQRLARGFRQCLRQFAGGPQRHQAVVQRLSGHFALQVARQCGNPLANRRPVAILARSRSHRQCCQRCAVETRFRHLPRIQFQAEPLKAALGAALAHLHRPHPFERLFRFWRECRALRILGRQKQRRENRFHPGTLRRKRIVVLGEEFLGRFPRDPAAQRRQQSGFILGGLILTKRSSKRGPHQKIRRSRMARYARSPRRRGGRPREPFFLPGIQVLRGQPWIPVAAPGARGRHHPQKRETGKHMRISVASNVTGITVKRRAL